MWAAIEQGCTFITMQGAQSGLALSVQGCREGHIEVIQGARRQHWGEWVPGKDEGRLLNERTLGKSRGKPGPISSSV